MSTKVFLAGRQAKLIDDELRSVWLMYVLGQEVWMAGSCEPKDTVLRAHKHTPIVLTDQKHVLIIDTVLLLVQTDSVDGVFAFHLSLTILKLNFFCDHLGSASRHPRLNIIFPCNVAIIPASGALSAR